MSVDTKVTPIPADAFSVEEKNGDTPAVNGAEFAAAETAVKAEYFRLCSQAQEAIYL